MAKVKVSVGQFNEKDIFKVDSRLKEIDEEEFNTAVAMLEPFLLEVEYTVTSSYDNSDDDRVEDSWDRYSMTRYFEIGAKENPASMLWSNGMIIGVVFFVSDRHKEDPYAFFFDDSVQQGFSLGYSASHSSQYSYINTVKLVARDSVTPYGKTYPAPYRQAKMYPSPDLS